MSACKTCSEPIDGNDKYVLCSGACNRLFHFNCAGLNVTNFRAWSSNVGLLWFCDACRVNFNPTVMDRESHILRALRDLLIRVDSMDLRIGQYAENMKTLNSLLSFPHVRRESNVDTRFQQQSSAASADFHHSIDRLNLDSSLHSGLGYMFGEHDTPITSETTAGPVARRTSALTTTTTAIPTVIVATTVTESKESDIPVSTTTPSTATCTIASTTTTNTTTKNCTTVASIVASGTETTVTSTATSTNNRVPQVLGQSSRLRVVSRNDRRRQLNNIDTTEMLKPFYVTPFHVEQTEEDVLEYLRETLNIENSTVRCVKLVPRGKQVNELTFVSFKVSVSPDLETTVGDSFYWPDGVTVREFEPKNDAAPINLRPPIQQ